VCTDMCGLLTLLYSLLHYLSGLLHAQVMCVNV